MVIVRTLLILLQLFLVATKMNNVCKTSWGYLFKQVSKDCRYNPDVNSNVPDMVKRNGYPIETYNVTTDDGFILTLYRIPHNNKDTKSARRPIFILHGVQTSSAVLVHMRDKSAAYYFSDRGYDIWMGNFRGVPGSQKHIKYTTRDYEYWDHGFHEIGIYDVSAFLNFIRKKTRKNGKIIYIGYSLGTTSSYIYASLKKEEAQENLAGIISLAPSAIIGDVKSIVRLLVPFRKLLDIGSKLSRQNSLFAQYHLIRLFYDFTCYQAFYPVCRLVFNEFGGYDYERLKPDQIPVIFGYFLNGGSLKTFLHASQLFVAKDKFLMYDYEKDNLEVYNQTKPPEYPIEEISLPTHLIFGKRDFLARPKGSMMLFDRLNTTKSITGIDYTHTDFLNAVNVKEYLYPIMTQKIKEIENFDEKNIITSTN